MPELSIRKIIEKTLSGEIRIPSFQRGFVWEPEKVAFFIDSLYKGYPIGSLLFWRTNIRLENERQLGNYSLPEPTKGYPLDYVLDGQQRLTSIYIGLKGTYAYKMPFKQWKNNSAFPERKLYLNIVEQAKDETDKYEFSFLTAEEVKNDTDHYWFEVGKILDMTELGDIMNYLMQNIAFSFQSKK